MNTFERIFRGKHRIRSWIIIVGNFYHIIKYSVPSLIRTYVYPDFELFVRFVCIYNTSPCIFSSLIRTFLFWKEIFRKFNPNFFLHWLYMYIHIYFNFLALNDKKKLNSLYLSLIMKFTPKRYKNKLTLVQKKWNMPLPWE